MKDKFLKSVKYYINKLSKKGLDIDKALDGKSVNKIASNKRTYENFLKRVKRIEERPKILEENKKIDIKRAKKRILEKSKKQIKEADLTKKTKNIIQYSKEFNDLPQFKDIENINDITELKKIEKQISQTTVKDKVVNYTDEYMNDFFGRYFKEFKFDPKQQNRIEKLKEGFKGRIDNLYDFIDYVEAQDVYKEYEDGATNKDDMTGSSYYSMMKNRLSRMEQAQKSKIYLK